MVLHASAIAAPVAWPHAAALRGPDSAPPIIAIVDSAGRPKAPEVSVQGLIFDVDKIAPCRAALFPFVTGDMAFDALVQTLSVLGLAADHADFVDFVLAFVRDRGWRAHRSNWSCCSTNSCSEIAMRCSRS